MPDICNWRELRDEAERLKIKYPSGTRVRCINMYDPYHPVPEGTIGTVTRVDDLGMIHVDWETGSTLSLIDGEDEFDVLYKPCEER